MTLEELQYWGTPPVTTTLTDNFGHPLGIIWPDGTITHCPPSNIGKELVEGYVISWDGGKPDPLGGHSKGRLLPLDGPRYVDSTQVFGYMARELEDEDDGQDETTAGTEWHVSKKKKRNRKKGQPQVT